MHEARPLNSLHIYEYINGTLDDKINTRKVLDWSISPESRERDGKAKGSKKEPSLVVGSSEFGGNNTPPRLRMLENI